jgi:hypothetical protein
VIDLNSYRLCVAASIGLRCTDDGGDANPSLCVVCQVVILAILIYVAAMEEAADALARRASSPRHGAPRLTGERSARTRLSSISVILPVMESVPPVFEDRGFDTGWL